MFGVTLYISAINNIYDLFITASGYEERATFIALKNINAKRKVVIVFSKNKQNKTRENNDKFYHQNKFEYLFSDGSQGKVITNIIDDFLKENQNHVINILVDYSSMTRVWYSSIIDYFNNLNTSKDIRVFFSYTRAQFTPPPMTEDLNHFCEPIYGFSNITIPNKETALILGLGYEKRRAFSLKEYFDAEEVYMFMTDAESAPDFYKDVTERNHELLSHVDNSHKFSYPLEDLLFTKKILYDLCKDLLNNFRVVIAPCGPKPFTLISLLVASELRNIDVWRISGNKDITNRKPTDDILTILVEFES